MKKWWAIMLTAMILSLCACGGEQDEVPEIPVEMSVQMPTVTQTEIPVEEIEQGADLNELVGTWKLIGTVHEGVSYSIEELQLMGQPETLCNYCFVLKDGGMGLDSEGDTFSWSVTEGTLILDGMECMFEDGIISFGSETTILKMEKSSDSQDLGEVSTNTEMAPTEEVANPEESEPESADGMRVEFKDAMDAYEEFYDEYCEFMEEYQKNPTDLTLLLKYTEMVGKMEEMDKAFEAWDEEELNDAELKYYLEVNNRVMQKLLEVAG